MFFGVFAMVYAVRCCAFHVRNPVKYLITKSVIKSSNRNEYGKSRERLHREYDNHKYNVHAYLAFLVNLFCSFFQSFFYLFTEQKKNLFLLICCCFRYMWRRFTERKTATIRTNEFFAFVHTSLRKKTVFFSMIFFFVCMRVCRIWVWNGTTFWNSFFERC